MRYSVRDGRLALDGTPCTLVGVNYHPSVAGCRLWADWDPKAIGRDFHHMAADGLTAVRLFLFWRDFQPEPTRVDPVVLGRLDETLSIAADAGLSCVLSLLTVWMNGQLLDLPWRQGRSPWLDSTMLDSEELYARQVAGVGAAHDNVLAYDLGDELWNIAPHGARALSRAQVADWQRRLAEAIRGVAAGGLVLQANDASGVFGTGPFGVDNAAGLDLIGTHAFPTWAPCAIDSTLSYPATHLPAFVARVAGAYGTPIVDELGSYGVDEETAAAYLSASGASALANGASGVLAWCWQDIVAETEPYDERPGERRTGLHREDGSAKPAMRELERIASAAAELAVARNRADVALYLPERLRGGGDSYLDAGGGAVATFFAYLLLKRAHLDFDVTGQDVTGRSLVVCPSLAWVTLADIRRLTAAARGGAVVYVSLGDHLHGFLGEQLVGAHIVDFCPPAGKSAVRWANEQWPIDWTAASARPTTMRPTTARVLARYEDGSAALVENVVGKGRFLFGNMPFERQLDRPGALSGLPWERFYAGIADLAGVAPLVGCTEPDVETMWAGAAPRPYAVAVNHSAKPVRAVLSAADAAGGWQREIALAAKQWLVVRDEGGASRVGVRD